MYIYRNIPNTDISLSGEFGTGSNANGKVNGGNLRMCIYSYSLRRSLAAVHRPVETPRSIHLQVWIALGLSWLLGSANSEGYACFLLALT